MNTESIAAESATQTAARPPEWLRTLGRCTRYLGIRTIVIGLTVLAGIYAAIWVTNLGGFADEIRRADIRYSIVMAVRGLDVMSTEERMAFLDNLYEAGYRAADLDQPFWKRSFRYFGNALSFSLGDAHHMVTGSGSDDVIDILMDGLPWTLLIFGVANVLTFCAGLYIALILSRRYGSLVDRTATLLVPVFATPPWFHGLFLIVIFALLTRILPFGGIVDNPIPSTQLGYVLSILKHAILPITALTLGTLPHAIYANRALFLIHSTEDFVELARAKGLASHRLRLRYILRPVLPAIITNFALVSIVSWQAVIITEHVFNWPGLGEVLIEAIRSNEVAVIVGAVTMFAYLIGITVLFLDIAYVLVDPRVSLGMKGRS